MRVYDNHNDIAIIGGGLSGALMAICAEAHGFTACVIDAQPSHSQNFDDFDGRSYAMAHTSVRMLRFGTLATS